MNTARGLSLTGLVYIEVEPSKTQPETMGARLLARSSPPAEGQAVPLHLAVHHDLDQLGAGAAEGGRECRSQLGGIAHLDRLAAERPRDAGEIDRRIDEVHADVVVVAVEGEQALLDDAIAAIVGDEPR